MSLNDTTLRKDEERWIAHFEQVRAKENAKLNQPQNPPISPVKNWMNTVFIYGKN